MREEQLPRLVSETTIVTNRQMRLSKCGGNSVADRKSDSPIPSLEGHTQNSDSSQLFGDNNQNGANGTKAVGGDESDDRSGNEEEGEHVTDF